MPLFFPRRRAARVSAVSPLWLITSITVPSSRTGSRYLNSLAYSTSTGILARFSITYLPMSPECQDVPQAVITILRMPLMSLSVMFRPPR